MSGKQKQLYEARPERRRKRRRPRKVWEKYVGEIARDRGIEKQSRKLHMIGTSIEKL